MDSAKKYEDLSGEELMERIPRGSVNINKMKSDIALIIGMILSVVTTRGQISFDLMTKKTFVVEQNGFRWSFIRPISKLTETHVECWAIYTVRNSPASSLLYTHRTDRGDFRGASKVAQVHKGVGVLLSALMKDPVVREHLQPFLEASEI